LVAPGGVLILSGILAEQAEGVIASAKAHGLTLQKKKVMGEWVALVVQ
jgi:ribosomal protein L11 methylase PrmA